MFKSVSRAENRDGARNTEINQPRREAVQNHIQSFTCRSSHYARRSIPGRKYLPNDLYVTKMHNRFHQHDHEQVIYTLYYSVIMYDFNLAFVHPAVDICSTRLMSKSQQNNLSITYRENHRRRAKRFYEAV